MNILNPSASSVKFFKTSPVVRSSIERGFTETPRTNRGVDHSHNSKTLQKTVFCVDTMRFTVHAERVQIEPLLVLLGVAGGLEEIGHGGTGFKVIESGLNGFQLYSEPVGNGGYFSFNLPGKFLQVLGHDNLIKCWDWLCESGLRFNATRFDIAFDQQEFITAQFVDAHKAGLIDCRAEKFKEIDSSDGHTFYLGSRSSEAMLRVYDKVDGNSFGDGVGFTRVELELKGDRALFAALQVFAAPIDQQHLSAAALLNGFVDVATDFWRDFIVTTKTAWLRLRAAVSSVAKIERWINKAVLPSLATLITAKTGGDVDEMASLFHELISAGRSRMSARHDAMVDNYFGDLPTEFIAAV